MSGNPAPTFGAQVALWVKSIYDLAQREANEWRAFRRDMVAEFSPRAPVGGQPGKFLATDTSVKMVFPANPGRQNAMFYNDYTGGATGPRVYLIFAEVGNSALVNGFSWGLLPNQGISLETIAPGYKGAVYASYSGADVTSTLGYTEFIG